MSAPPTLVLTRPEAQSIRFAEQCRARFGCGLNILIAPLMEIRHLKTDLPPPVAKTVIFSSVNGVRSAKANWPDAVFSGYAVGARTAAVGAEVGYDLISADGDVESLFSRLMAEAPHGSMVHLRGVHSRGDLAERLISAGIETDSVVLYDQVECPASDGLLTALCGEMPLIVPLFSPRSATIFSAKAKGCAAPLHLVCISDGTARAVGVETDVMAIAQRPDAAHMLDAIEALVQ